MISSARSTQNGDPILGLWAEKDVHGTRVFLKRLRAILSLIPELDVELDYRLGVFKKISKSLAKHRDLESLREIIKDLQKTQRLRKKQRYVLSEILRALRRDAPSRHDRISALRSANRTLRNELHGFTESLTNAGIENPTPWTFREPYRKARQLWKDCRGGSSVEELHEWRTQAKALQYQLEYFKSKGLHPEIFLKPLQKLGRRLGTVHDLQVLLDTASRLESSGRISKLPDSLQRKLKKRQNKLIDKALSLAPKAFALKPRDFSVRVVFESPGALSSAPRWSEDTPFPKT